MKIAFIHNHRLFCLNWPPISLFFKNKILKPVSLNIGKKKLSDADVYWYLMGFFPKSFHKKKLIIHEYASASVPPYRKLKDFLKSRLTPRPHFRLYLNEYVREQMNIHDEVPLVSAIWESAIFFFNFRNTDRKGI